ncbi:imm11 family protein [Bradyrhizobium betae]|nr:DUF1629 domain-containing protein [Bradyrhizobium betae]MCS3726514.1 hypothetical protein [Bradyrhizobium betae]
MSDDRSRPIEKRPREIKRKFYVIDFNYRGGPPAMVLENRHVLAPDTGVLDPFPRRGFPNYPEPPRFVFGGTRDRAPRDLEMYHHYWLVSDRTKAVFESVDLAGFAFVACDIRLAKGQYEGPGYWLCDVVRVLDAVDESQSRLLVGIRDDPNYRDFDKKYYSVVIKGGARLVFRDEVIASAHVFRMAYMEATVICDDVLKNACKEAGLAGIGFRDVLKLPI